MSVEFDDRRIILFGDGLLYERYYFLRAAQDTGADYKDLLKRVLAQWADALGEAADCGGVAFLPFGFGDEGTECFAATIEGGRVTLRSVVVDVEGHALDLLALRRFMGGPHRVLERCPEVFGAYEVAELVRALKEAEQAAA